MTHQFINGLNWCNTDFISSPAVWNYETRWRNKHDLPKCQTTRYGISGVLNTLLKFYNRISHNQIITSVKRGSRQRHDSPGAGSGGRPLQTRDYDAGKRPRWGRDRSCSTSARETHPCKGNGVVERLGELISSKVIFIFYQFLQDMRTYWRSLCTHERK